MVRQRRHDLGIVQDDLALAAGTGRRFIVDLEAGKPTVRLAHVLAVLHALGLRVRIELPADPAGS